MISADREQRRTPWNNAANRLRRDAPRAQGRERGLNRTGGNGRQQTSRSLWVEAKFADFLRDFRRKGNAVSYEFAVISQPSG
jgi:hypothetical protein